MFEHFFQCPYCWEDISMLLDSSLVSTEYVEDCEICCNPNKIDTETYDGEIVSLIVSDGNE